MSAARPDALALLRAPGVVEAVEAVVETHMSWVLLTARRAYKLKKPVRLPWLDHGTLARRRRSCAQEVRLGRRLAPDVYEAAAPLVTGPAGPSLGGPGEVVDWVVVMRRLPAARMLPATLAAGAATAEDAAGVGERLAAFYAAAPRAPWGPAEYRQRLRATLVAIGGELVARGAPRAQVAALVGGGLGLVATHAAALDARIDAGCVVDAHGDLRPEHVCLERPPVIIDPLEFDAELRLLDRASELAFFALECERLGAGWFAEAVLARCATRAGDAPPPPLVRLYRRHHALTRALLALRHLDDAAAAEGPRWRARADDYLARA